MRRRLLEIGSALAAMWCLVSACAGEEERREDRFEKDSEDVGAGGAVGSSVVATGVGGSGGEGNGATTSSSSSVTTGGGGCSYAAPNSCTSAQTVEEMAGDKGGDLRTVKGTTDLFVKVFVAEKVGSIFTFPKLKLAARLDDSPGMDFDLIAYVGGETPHCDGESYSFENDPEYMEASWGDSKNSDDGRWWVFEIVHKSGGACGADAEWTLTLAGNYDIECENDGMCTADDDCVCAECGSDEYCSDPNYCNDNGVCDTYSEGCVCADCAQTPACL